jgi:hypothetical protein
MTLTFKRLKIKLITINKRYLVMETKDAIQNLYLSKLVTAKKTTVFISLDYFV